MGVESIEIGSSIRPLRHCVSHGCAQMRPQMEASGFGARAIWYPFAVSHSATART
jgi:hypothetical protein